MGGLTSDRAVSAWTVSVFCHTFPIGKMQNAKMRHCANVQVGKRQKMHCGEGCATLKVWFKWREGKGDSDWGEGEDQSAAREKTEYAVTLKIADLTIIGKESK